MISSYLQEIVRDGDIMLTKENEGGCHGNFS